jgi:hypothetical protein
MSVYSPYTREFYDLKSNGSLQSARVIVPVLLRYFRITSVVDVGCGVGNWLKVFQENGITSIRGIDGPHVDDTMLAIDKNAFTAVDLREQFQFRNRYDLAVSLEVAEHLSEDHATSFVKKLTDVAPVVLFSAAVPGQPGVEHVNLQWQDYWRKIFAELDYVPSDIIRPVIWGRLDVEYWYQQNTIVYCQNQVAVNRPDIPYVSKNISLNIIHPLLYDYKRIEYEEAIRIASPLDLKKAISAIPSLTIKAARRRLSSYFG